MHVPPWICKNDAIEFKNKFPNRVINIQIKDVEMIKDHVLSSL